MIKVETLVISEFRGIRNMTLNLNQKNFAVCGPNGTGKSGVVDALEFVLTGTISRLTGKGRGDLSIKEHGPHVDSRKEPEKAYVEAVVWIPSLNTTVKARRTVKAPAVVELTPDSPKAQLVFRQLEAHPEIALSRREIIRFVLTEPGQRAKDVQALLKLDELEALRTRLQKIANSADSVSRKANTDRDTARSELVRAMEISEATGHAILDAANKRRVLIGLQPLQALGIDGSIRDGLTSTEGSQASRVNKPLAKADTDAAVKSIRLRSEAAFEVSVAEAKQATAALQADEGMLNAVVRDDFLKTALELYDAEFCPACDTPKGPEEFTAIIQEKRAKLVAVKVLREKAENAIIPLRDLLDSDYALARSIYQHAKLLLSENDVKILTDFGARLKSDSEQLQAFMPVDKTLEALNSVSVPKDFFEMLGRLEAKIDALPEPSAQDAAREFLITAQLRLDKLRGDSSIARTAEYRATRARKVFNIYKETSDAALEKVYSDVQGHFADLYRRINSDDEGGFEAKLTPSLGKLGFGVDFFTRGFFPPGAYHSEGHQDSMGLCLYLALMRYLLGGGFTFAVLDDVLMSVDAGHRREVSKLLRSEFPETQFVLTTHDKAWLKFMSTTMLVEPKDTVHFRKWTVDDGPFIWAAGDVWAEIRKLADLDDVPGAAGLLRRSLEHLSAEFCQALRVKVEFSVDGHHDLGELPDPAISQLKMLYKDARVAAESWQDTGRIATIQDRESSFNAAAAAAKVEQWQINPSVHYNEWANLQKNEFLAVVEAFEALCRQFSCHACGVLFEVNPSRGSKEYIQCLCGTTKYAFMKRPKQEGSK